MRFAQIIEYRTTRIDEVDRLMDDWLRRTEGRRTATRALQTSDRDQANTYVEIVEFPSYEAAMANNDLPETAEIADQLAKLAEGPPIFRNLDIRRDDPA